MPSTSSQASVSSSLSPQPSSTNNPSTNNPSNNNVQAMHNIFTMNGSPTLVVAFLAIGLFTATMAALFGWKRMHSGRLSVRTVRQTPRPRKKPTMLGEKPTLWEMWTRREEGVTIDTRWENITVCLYLCVESSIYPSPMIAKGQLVQVADGIKYLYKQGIAHGNLTGDDILDASGRKNSLCQLKGDREDIAMIADHLNWRKYSRLGQLGGIVSLPSPATEATFTDLYCNFSTGRAYSFYEAKHNSRFRYWIKTWRHSMHGVIYHRYKNLWSPAPSISILLTGFSRFVEQTARTQGVAESDNVKELASALWEIVDGYGNDRMDERNY
ncbi:hypothetical protein DFH29DRAFT_878602 [Suillus ampliporus]|nr:hypothetical protein DFH29DRAFT_878602 [Suillus ampliporus]